MRNKINYLFIPLILILGQCNMGNHNVIKVSDNSLTESAINLYKKNDYLHAKEAFDKVLQKDSSNGLIFYQRAYCKGQLLDFNGSIKDLEKAIELNYSPDTSNYAIGLDYIALDNDSLALKYFYKAYSLNKNYEEAKYEIIHAKRRLHIKEN